MDFIICHSDRKKQLILLLRPKSYNLRWRMKKVFTPNRDFPFPPFFSSLYKGVECWLQKLYFVTEFRIIYLWYLFDPRICCFVFGIWQPQFNKVLGMLLKSMGFVLFNLNLLFSLLIFTFQMFSKIDSNGQLL